MKRALWGLLVVAIAVGGGIGARIAFTDSEPRAAVSSSPSASTSRAQTATPTPSTATAHPVSLPALMAKDFNGRGFTVGRVRERNSVYTGYTIRYRSGNLTISGIMNVPRGSGPFPVLVLAHGYIDPAVYTTGRGFERSQAFLPRRGYAVVHVDYRNHAESDDDPHAELRLRLGYVEDVVNAVLAVRSSSLPYLDVDRIGLLGRSMGGGVALSALVVKPDLVDAAVLFAPVSSDAVDNYNRWIRRPQRRALAERIAQTYGAPAENPSFWREISARAFLDRVAAPIQIHHGTADESVPIVWSRRTVDLLRRAGKDVTFFQYPGEGHAFGPAFGSSMERATAFFDRHLTG